MNGSSRLAWGGLIAEYRDLLPVTGDAAVITLGEGATPLIPAPVLSERTGCRVYLKVEGANPTGSFKDRGMTVAVTMAVAHGAQAVICASTGNTSASAAAYAAADALVLPVDAQMIAFAPSSTARLTATVMPRSLNEPVGFAPSTLR